MPMLKLVATNVAPQRLLVRWCIPPVVCVVQLGPKLLVATSKANTAISTAADMLKAREERTLKVCVPVFVCAAVCVLVCVLRVCAAACLGGCVC